MQQLNGISGTFSGFFSDRLCILNITILEEFCDWCCITGCIAVSLCLAEGTTSVSSGLFRSGDLVLFFLGS